MNIEDNSKLQDELYNDVINGLDDVTNGELDKILTEDEKLHPTKETLLKIENYLNNNSNKDGYHI